MDLPEQHGRGTIDLERLGAISCFVAVAEQASFVAAAAALGISASTVSRKVSALEETIGVRLFDRTTRRVALTEAGRLYFDQCVDILDHLADADADALVASMNREPRELLRVSVPVVNRRGIRPPFSG